MSKEERIKYERLCNDFIVKYNLDNHPVMENLDCYYNLVSIAYQILEPLYGDAYDLEMSIPSKDKIDAFDLFEITSDFFKKIDINIDIDDLVQKGIIGLYYCKGNTFCVDGHCTTKNGITFTDIEFTGEPSNFPVLAHELAHYTNMVNNRNINQDLFTETMSTCTELIACDYIKNLYPKINFDTYVERLYYFFYLNCKSACVFFRLLNTFRTFGDLTKESYSILYDENLYENDITYIKKYPKIVSADFIDLDYALAGIFGNYMYLKFTINPAFIVNINNFNKSLSQPNSLITFNTIGLTNLNNKEKEILFHSLEKRVSMIENQRSLKEKSPKPKF